MVYFDGEFLVDAYGERADVPHYDTEGGVHPDGTWCYGTGGCSWARDGRCKY